MESKSIYWVQSFLKNSKARGFMNGGEFFDKGEATLIDCLDRLDNDKSESLRSSDNIDKGSGGKGVYSKVRSGEEADKREDFVSVEKGIVGSNGLNERVVGPCFGKGDNFRSSVNKAKFSGGRGVSTKVHVGGVAESGEGTFLGGKVVLWRCGSNVWSFGSCVGKSGKGIVNSGELSSFGFVFSGVCFLVAVSLGFVFLFCFVSAVFRS
ncbi:hypothetical protein QYF36_020526 [Acer negundo]|nr:hypothetical protein QYF36_020526 [Acer negundo]